MTLIEILAPTYVQTLGGLSAWLGKIADGKPGGSGDALLSARLAPDMLPLSTQVSFACVQAQEGVFRLRQEHLPPSIEVLLNEGRNAAERPGTLEEARAKIAATISIVEVAAADAPDIDPATPIVHALPQGMVFDLNAEQYVRDWALPQFYFHVMAAYAILRAQGVQIGKQDYVSHMSAYLRPGTIPPQ